MIASISGFVVGSVVVLVVAVAALVVGFQFRKKNPNIDSKIDAAVNKIERR